MSNKLTESKFHMWRGCVAILLIDKKVHEKELKWFEEKIRGLDLSDEQRQIIFNDLEKSVSFEEIIPLVTNKADKAFLLHQVRVLGHLDGEFDSEEKEAFRKLEMVILDKLDIEGIRAEVEKMEIESYHIDEVYRPINEHSIFERECMKLLKILNMGDYKF